MFKKLYLLGLIILFCFTSGICLAKYSGGDGSPATPYRISNPYDMNNIGLHEEDWGSHFVMVNDVNLSEFTGTQFNIIGYFSWEDGNAFTGVFDGNGFNISNFTYTSTGTDDVGIFGLVGTHEDSNAVIKDLTLIDPNVSAGVCSDAGSLVGMLYSGCVSNCSAVGGIVSGKNGVGGLIGLVGIQMPFPMPAKKVVRCSANVRVVGLPDGYNAGGLSGTNYFGTISECYSLGDVSGYNNVGGLTGWTFVAEFLDSYATGDVSGNAGVGGLVGLLQGSIADCFSSGTVTGASDVGGLVGDMWFGGYTACFWDSDINPDVNGIGNATDPNVIGKSTAEMQTESTFTNAGWDFVGETINGPNDIWTIHDTVDYPKLVLPLVNFVGWYEVDLADYAFFSNYWKDTNCGVANDCNGVDLDFSDAVDGKDLKILFDKWLTGL